MRRLFRWGVQLRLWVALCVAMLGAFCADFLAQTTPPSDTTSGYRTGVLLLFFATLALYNLDGTFDTPHQSPLERRTHLGLTCVSSLVLFALLAHAPQRIVAFVGLGFLACSFYALPFRNGARSIKRLPGLKAPFVGVAVASASMGIPALSQRSLLPGQPFSSLFFAVLLTLSFYCTANALLFDIPDVDEDRKSGVPTLVSRWGLEKTRTICRILCLCGVVLSPAPALLGKAGVMHSVGLVTLGVILLVACHLIRKTTSKQTIAWWVDGSLAVPFLLLGFRRWDWGL